jgi:molecular chaperone IbpA
MFDLSPLSRFGIGFDRMFDLLDGVMQADTAQTYPPYDIEKTGENAYRISLAVAGFRPDELSITTEPNLLVVAGEKAEPKEKQYLHRGIAAADFERQFTLADHVKVAGASLDQGMLTIDLVHEVPEEMKPRRIAIANGNQPKTIENRKAA